MAKEKKVKKVKVNKVVELKKYKDLVSNLCNLLNIGKTTGIWCLGYDTSNRTTFEEIIIDVSNLRANKDTYKELSEQKDREINRLQQLLRAIIKDDSLTIEADTKRQIDIKNND